MTEHVSEVLIKLSVIGDEFINYVRARLVKKINSINSFGTFVVADYSLLEIDDYEAIANGIFVD